MQIECYLKQIQNNYFTVSFKIHQRKFSHLQSELCLAIDQMSLIIPKNDRILPQFQSHSRKSSLPKAWYLQGLESRSTLPCCTHTQDTLLLQWAQLDRRCKQYLERIFWNLNDKEVTHLQLFTIEQGLTFGSQCEINRIFLIASLAQKLNYMVGVSLERFHQIFADMAEMHTKYCELAGLIHVGILKLLTLLAHHF